MVNDGKRQCAGMLVLWIVILCNGAGHGMNGQGGVSIDIRIAGGGAQAAVMMLVTWLKLLLLLLLLMTVSVLVV